jgi:hypothetical protein
MVTVVRHVRICYSVLVCQTSDLFEPGAWV